MDMKIAVIGAGNGGCAIGAYLASCGVEVNLCDLFPQYLAGIRDNDGIDLTVDGKTSHQKMNLVTESVAEAIRDVKLIMVVTPSFTHKMIAQAAATSLSDGQVVVLNPGRTGGALEFCETVRAKGCTADITVAETQTLIYSCRKTGPASVGIFGVKKEVTLGAFPANRTADVLKLLNPYYPQFTPASSCLETSLSNIGALFHPTPVDSHFLRCIERLADFSLSSTCIFHPPITVGQTHRFIHNGIHLFHSKLVSKRSGLFLGLRLKKAVLQACLLGCNMFLYSFFRIALHTGVKCSINLQSIGIEIVRSTVFLEILGTPSVKRVSFPRQ